MKHDSLFGSKPKRLKALAALGLEDSGEHQDSGGAETQASPFLEKVGDWIGAYELLSVLGEGGMGIVYLAQQHRPIRRQVALKLVKPGMDSKKIIARFEAEQQALAVMDHAHVAHVYDAGLTAAGRPYFVMEYVEGVPITEHCDTHTLTIDQRLELFLQVCAAVQHAHYKGIIHRDLKPSNILISIQDNQTVPKVIDFGIAKALNHGLGQPLNERTLYTEQGQFLGTPEYMSPEQAASTAQGTDTRTDVYSLGVVLYELLTGVLPFDTDTFRKGGSEHIRRMIREQDPKTPSTRLSTVAGDESSKLAALRRTDSRSLGRTLHGDLDWITLKAMEKDPDRRYTTAQALADDIQRHLRHEPITAGAPSLAYRLRKFLRRNRTRVAAVAGVVVLLSCVTALTITSSRASRQAQVAARLRDRETLYAAQEAFSERRIADAMKEVVPILESESVGEQAQLLQANILMEGGHPQEAETILVKLVNNEPQIAGAAHALLARIYWEGGNDEVDALERATHHRQEAERLLPETADAFYLRALTALTVKETLGMLEKALSLDPRHFQSLRLHAYTLWASERYRDLEADALALIVARPRDSLGYLLSATARFEQHKYEQALQETERHLEFLAMKCRSLLALGQHQRVIEETHGGLQAFPDARILAFHQYCALLGVGDYDRAGELFYRFGLVNGRANRDFLNWGTEYVFDTQAAGQAWHHRERPPKGLPFIHMHEAEDNYRALAAKGKRLINKGFASAWSPDGTKLAYAMGVPGVSGVAIYDFQTHQSELLTVPGRDPRWSPDGQHLVFARGRRVLDIASLPSVERRRFTPLRKDEEVWIMRPDGTEARRLALGGLPSWSPDGKRVFYHSRVENAIYEVAAHDRAAQPRRIRTTGNLWPSVSPDGQQVAWIRDDNRLCLWNMNSTSTDPTHRVDFPDMFFLGGTWSPDGRFFHLGGFGPIVRAGLWIYDVQQGHVRKVLSGRIRSPNWSGDARTLAFTVGQPIFEIWTAHSTSLGAGKTLEEHDREMIAHCTRRIACEFGPATDSRIHLGVLRASNTASLTISKPILYLMRASCYVRLNELDKAIADIEQATQISNEPHKTAPWLAKLKTARKEGWSPAQILAGSSTYDPVNDTYTVVGSGDDMYRSFDECRFTYSRLDGDGSITARIDRVEHVHEYTKAGVTIRNTLAPDSARIAVLATPTNRLFLSQRKAKTAVTQDIFTPTQFIDPPHWIRLTRKGNCFTGEHSSDGMTWKTIADFSDPNASVSVAIPMNEAVYVGLAISSHNTTRSAESQFSGVKLVGDITPNGPLVASEDIRLDVNALPRQADITSFK